MTRVKRLLLLLALPIAIAWASDEAALLEAIRTQPGEDTPRLAYADWLDEHNRPKQAEFIRSQIARFRKSGLSTAVSTKDVLQENSALDEILGPDRLILERAGVVIRWERGFPALVHIPRRALLAEGAIRALNVIPFTSSIELPAFGVPFGQGGIAISEAEFQNALASLTLVERAASIKMSANSLNYTQLRDALDRFKTATTLEFSADFEANTAENLRALAESALAPHLRCLRIDAVSLPDQCSRILEGKRFPNLESLELNASNSQRGSISLAFLREPKAYDKLRELSLGHSRVDRDEMQALIRSPVFAQLERFVLPEPYVYYQTLPGPDEVPNWIASLPRHSLIEFSVPSIDAALQKKLDEQIARNQQTTCFHLVQAVAEIVPRA